MSTRELDLDNDNTIDVTNLSEELRVLPSIMFGYREILAKAEEESAIKKAEYEELCAAKYLEIRAKEGKITESTLEAMIEVDLEVKAAKRAMLEAQRDYKTLDGYMESMRAKKDSLIQLSADQRKEK